MTKRKLMSTIALLLAMITVVSCGPTTQIETPETTLEITNDITTEAIFDPSIPDGVLFAGPQITTTCAVVYPSGATTLRDAAENFANYFMKLIPGSNFTFRSPNSTADEDYQIVLLTDDKIETSFSIKLDSKTINVTGKDTENTLQALSYLKLIAYVDGYFAIPEALDFTSGDGPVMFEYSPENLYYYEDVYTPSLYYKFADTMINKEACRLVIDGVDVTDRAVWEFGRVTLDSITVDPGEHTAILCLTSDNGSVELVETLFTCGDASEMNLYSGELHAHTGDSDGKETVKVAYKYARDVANLDFFSVTDHSNSFTNNVYQSKHQTNADSYNEPGKFVALFGFEQTYSAATYYGHLNSINYNTLTTRSTLLEDYYAKMTTKDGAIVMFNHPGYKWGNFCEFEFWTEEYDKTVNLIEIKGKSYDVEYALCLTKGWHVSPLYNEDNHSANWGNAYEYCGYALAPSLTRQNIVEAFQKNRTYTTTDKTLKIYYKINDEWMGSRLNNPDKLKVSIDLSTEKAIGLGTVQLIAEDNIVVAQQSVGRKKSYTWEFEIDPTYDYYYVKVSADSTWAVTAPIWIENREELTITEITQQLVETPVSGKDQRIIAHVKNNAQVALTDVVVDFYTSSNAGFNITTKNPLVSVKIGDLAAGASIEAYADITYTESSNRVYAIVSGMANGQKYGAVRYCEISNLYFTEIVAQCQQGGATAYEFIEIYNNSNQTINLSSYSIRYYAKPGANADSLTENTWKLTGTIAPRSTVVLWFAGENSTLSIADFNKRYGTNLVGGKDIIVIVGKNLAETNPVQLEILHGTTVVSRCWYNWEGELNIIPDKSVTFNYPTCYTLTARVDKARTKPTPGSLLDGQMPKLVK